MAYVMLLFCRIKYNRESEVDFRDGKVPGPSNMLAVSCICLHVVLKHCTCTQCP